MPDLLIWAHHERRRLLIVKWAARTEIHPRWRELDVVFDEVDDVEFGFYFFGGLHEIQLELLLNCLIVILLLFSNLTIWQYNVIFFKTIIYNEFYLVFFIFNSSIYRVGFNGKS